MESRPNRSGLDVAVGVGPLAQLFLEFLALIDDELTVVRRGDLEPFERPGRGAFEVDPRDVEAATVARALELLLAREPVRRAPQMSTDRLDGIDDVGAVVAGRADDPEAPFGLEPL